MRLVASEGFAAMRRGRARAGRVLRGEAMAVHYFHQVDDPYSHLAVQKLAALQQHYRVPFIPHLVGPPADEYKGDAARYASWAAGDAESIAEFHGVEFPRPFSTPAGELVVEANRVLAAALSEGVFPQVAAAVGTCIWQGQPPGAGLPQQDHERAIREGEALRTRLGHYFGGMFYFEGEWFWGVDRLHLLEARLQRQGLGNEQGPLVAPLPTPPAVGNVDAGNCVLEYFPSLRSPYTAVGHRRVLDLVERTGVNLQLRPVIPMMMRGVPAPRAKRLYIMTDAAREARYYGVPFGRFVDPLGDPVRRAFAWYPLALQAGKGVAFVTAYLSAAFERGLDVTSDEGLAALLSQVGLDPQTRKLSAVPDDWERLLEQNLKAMLAAGLWGVPSFRVSGGNGAAPFACWGQDRIWRVEVEICRRAGSQALR